MAQQWFPMQRETFNVVLYSFLGAYKIIIFVFNIVPWVVLADHWMRTRCISV
jgi:hypothetical protein